MVKVQVGKHNYYLDGYLKKNLDGIKQIVKKDWDFVFCIDGMEGGGKSTFALQMALYLDPKLTLEQVVFSADDFERQIIGAEKFSAVVYDEAITGLYSREAMQYINTTLTKLLAQIRQKNLFIFVIIPTFFDLDKYVAMWRSRGLFHIYTKNFTRGFFIFFDHERKKNLYAVGKKYYNYHLQKPSFKGRYTRYNPFLKEYVKKKFESLQARVDQQTNTMVQRDRFINHLHLELGLSQRNVGFIGGVSQSTVAYVTQKETHRQKHSS